MEITMTMIGEGIYPINVVLAIIIIFRTETRYCCYLGLVISALFTASHWVSNLCLSWPAITRG